MKVWLIQEEVDYEEFKVHEVALTSPEEMRKYFNEQGWSSNYIKNYIEIIEAVVR